MFSETGSMRLLLLPASAAMVLLLPSCAQSGPTAHPALAGAWSVAEIDGAPVPDGVPADVAFSEDGKVSGIAGCNRYGGDYAYKEGVLTLNRMIMTEMGCFPEDRMRFESAFHNRFQGALTVAAPGEGVLTLSDKEGSLRLRRR